MADLTRDFYNNFYLSEGILDLDEVIQVIPAKITESMNEALLQPIKEEEVKSALFQMFLTKAPGPDGFLAHFFKHIGSFVARRLP
jgi:hypothetical protein